MIGGERSYVGAERFFVLGGLAFLFGASVSLFGGPERFFVRLAFLLTDSVTRRNANGIRMKKIFKKVSQGIISLY